MKLVDQLELFPLACKDEISTTTELLTNYKKMKECMKDFEMNTSSSGYSIKYDLFCEVTSYIDRAFNLIQDDEVKRVIEQRFFKTNKRKATVAIFKNIMSESTVDRRIDEGIASIANTLKLWNVI